MQTSADDLYTKVWPEYIEIQRKDLFWYERLWGVLLRQLEKRQRRRLLLDVGCGPGFLMRFAHHRGWSVVGVEPSNVAATHARYLGEDLSYPAIAHWFIVVPKVEILPDDWYPAVISTEVLEHLEQPLAALLEWRDHLTHDGLLAISVPNDGNPLQRLFWGRKKPWIHHTHKSYFNMKSLCSLLEEAGFKVVWRRTSFPVEILLAIPFMKRNWAWKMSRVWPAPPFLWRFGIGRHLLVVAKKA